MLLSEDVHGKHFLVGDVQTSRGKDKGVEHDGPSLMGKWKLDALPTRDELLKVEERHGDEDHSGD